MRLAIALIIISAFGIIGCSGAPVRLSDDAQGWVGKPKGFAGFYWSEIYYCEAKKNARGESHPECILANEVQ